MPGLRLSALYPVLFAALVIGPAPAAGAPSLLVTDSGRTLVWDGITIHTGPHAISDPQALSLPGSAGVAILWRETQDGGRRTDAYAISPDGRRFARAREASYLLRLRYAEFDPLAVAPPVAPALAADPTATLAIIQF